MGITTPRKKPKNIFISFIYRAQKMLPFGAAFKLKLFLNLEWIFERLAHEASFKVYTSEKHHIRQFSKDFIFKNIQESDKVLDLGCKSGDISNMLAEKVKEVVAIDYDKNAIELAKQKYNKPNLKFHHREALEYLKENGEEFDVLILSHILEHLDNPKDFILNFKDYFKHIYIEVPDFDRSYLNHYRKDLGLKLIYSDDDHISEFDRDELELLLKQCNIQILDREFRFGVQKLWCRVNK